MATLNAKQLRQLCNEAYDKYPYACNFSVNYIMNGSLEPGESTYTRMLADALIDCLDVSPLWTNVRLDQVADLASGGNVVVGGKKANGNGHVIVVYPGPTKPAGGYFFTKTDKNCT